MDKFWQSVIEEDERRRRLRRRETLDERFKEDLVRFIRSRHEPRIEPVRPTRAMED